jgi:hypothetical protein
MENAVGVPEISHVVELIESPAGSDGEAEQEVMVDPLSFKVVGLTDKGTSTIPFVPSEPS